MNEKEVLTKDKQQLVEEVLRLEKELKRAENERDLFYHSYTQEKEKLGFVKKAVKSMVLFIESEP
ncbi:MAG: hypothetical protein LBL07_05670 [Tannerella sp.]|jgi:uncharacterized protein (UPF0335 family)|nr:hypothetical protein [Tannerella sp.]